MKNLKCREKMYTEKSLSKPNVFPPTEEEHPSVRLHAPAPCAGAAPLPALSAAGTHPVGAPVMYSTDCGRNYPSHEEI